MKTVGIIQSNYIPWKGYFDIIGLCDEFILLDNVQFTKNDWRNRNRIKTPGAPAWLTIPVKTGGRFGQAIDETEIADAHWAERHWSKLRATYGHAAGFAQYAPRFESLYLQAAAETRLSAVNRLFIGGVCDLLGIRTRLSDASDYPGADGKNERVIALCKAAGAGVYISGPAARGYIDEAQFAAAGVAVRYMNYAGYPEYDQPNPPFEHAVSVLDLLFCTGSEAPAFMKFASAHRDVPAADRPQGIER